MEESHIMKTVKHFLLALGLGMGLCGAFAFADVAPAPAPEGNDGKVEKITASRAEVLMVLDKSGSMYDMTNDTIGGFNSMIQKYRDMKLPVRVTTVLFNDKSKVLHDRQDINTIRELTGDDYTASGTTALLDALGQSITRLSEVPDVKEGKDTQVVVVIITDGQENSSKEYKKSTVKNIIEDMQKKGWKFMFLGANIDAVSEAGSLGIDTNNAVKYRNTGSAVRSNYDAVVNFTVEAMEAPASGSMKGNWKDSVEKDDTPESEAPESAPKTGAPEKSLRGVK